MLPPHLSHNPKRSPLNQQISLVPLMLSIYTRDGYRSNSNICCNWYCSSTPGYATRTYPFNIFCTWGWASTSGSSSPWSVSPSDDSAWRKSSDYNGRIRRKRAGKTSRLLIRFSLSPLWMNKVQNPRLKKQNHLAQSFNLGRNNSRKKGRSGKERAWK